MYRSASPALSENEIDISRSLAKRTHGDASDSEAASDIEQDDVASIPESEDDEDEAFIAATQAAVNRKNDSKTAKKAGAFQTMGLNQHLLKAITRKGFTVPTPIQRKTIPMILDGQDVVGMARTGSGKTAAFVIPMIEKLKSHSVKVGARAAIMSPSRELALQTLKVVKELSKGTDLRITLLVGGDSLEEQFGSMASNPDIIIATPGRFEHLKVEMRLELSSVKYVVFDEADRLFEMGFAAQLTEIMHSLPSNRQTLLFSATLPKSLVEFARAGLQDPILIRLDAESKIAPELQSAFFTVKRAEKEGALLHILEDVIRMPTGPTEASQQTKEHKSSSKKRKRDYTSSTPSNTPSPHSTVLFAATKHHVEYLAHLLQTLGYATSYVYGSLDQTARKMQTEDFRTGKTNIMVVTDVAARGLDIPVLANVINYDFPSQPKIFVHRVGRTARAGKTGWSYSLVTGQDMPYLLDLQLFLSKKLVLGRAVGKEDGVFRDSVVVGSLVRDKLERCCEEIGKLVEDDIDLSSMRDVAGKGEKQYLRTRNAASAESVKRAKLLAQDERSKGANLLFDDDDGDGGQEQQRLEMLARVSGFRPQETVFEIGRKGASSAAADIMRKRRAKIEPKHRVQKEDDGENATADDAAAPAEDVDVESDHDELILTRPSEADMDPASDSELDLTFTQPTFSANPNKESLSRKRGWQDLEHFMPYTPTTINLAEDKGYGVQSGGANSHFLEAAKDATMDLTNDESKAFAAPSKMRWDKKSKKYVSTANDTDGSKGTKYIRGESGLKIAASLRSGRFDAWRKANKISSLPRVGEMERSNSHVSGDFGGKRWKHKQEKAPKEADKFRDDFEVRKKRVAEAREKRVGRFKDGKGRNEVRGVEDVRKARVGKERRREKNARPARRK